MILLLRRQLLKLPFLPHVHRFSTTPKPPQPQIPNPFKHKSYTEISKIMSLNISQKNEIIFCSLVLRTALERIEQNFNQKKQGLSHPEQAAKEELINKTLEKMLSKLDSLSPEDVYLLVNVVLQAYENRYIRLTKGNKDRYKIQLQNRLAQMVEQDKTGQHRETFKKILYLMLKFKKRIAILKQIIDYLTIHDLKTNSQLLNFFTQVSYLNRTGYYDSTVEPFVSRIMDPKINNINNAHQWVKPIVLETVALFTDKLRIQGNRYFEHFLVGLRHQFQNNRLGLNDEVLIFRQLLKWAQVSSPYLLKIGQISQGAQLIYSMMKDITKRVQQKQRINFNEFLQVIELQQPLRQFAKSMHKILGKDETQLATELHNFLQLLFDARLLTQLDSMNASDIVTVLNTNFQPDLHANKILTRAIIKTLLAEEGTFPLITKLRVYEYLVLSIIEGKTDMDASAMEPLLRKIEQNSHKLKQYQIIRVYNMFRLLKIESTTFNNLFKYQMVKKESVVIENMARTYLKNYSVDIIKSCADSIIKKYYEMKSDQVSESNLRQIVWSSLKRIKTEGKNQNRDPMMTYWLEQNWPFFCNLTKNFRLCYLILSNAVKQFNVQSKGIQHSINQQLLLQILKSWHDQNTEVKAEDYNIIILENLKHFIESDNMSAIFQGQYRHSFFVKIMWGIMILNANAEKNLYAKRFRQISQVFILTKLLKLTLYRERPNIQALMLQKYLNTLNLSQQIKMKSFHNISQAIFWSYYHGVTWVPRGSNYKGHNSEEKIQGYIREKFGNVYLAEYLIAESKTGQESKKIDMKSLLKDSPLLLEICESTLSKDSKIADFDLLDSFVFPNILCFLFERSPDMCPIYVEKILSLGDPLMEHKIAEAANLIEKVKKYLDMATRRKVKKHLKNLLLTNFPPEKNQSSIPLHLKLNLNPQNPSILSYIKTQLHTNNYFLIPLLYINGHTGLTAHIDELLNWIKINRVLPFMNLFRGELLGLVNGILGVGLNQGDDGGLVGKCVRCVFGDNVEDLAEVVNDGQIGRKEDCYQFFILISVAISRLPAQSPQRNTLASTIKKISTQNPNLKSDILSSIITQTLSQIPPPLSHTFPPDPTTKLPTHNSHPFLIDPEQPGFTGLVREYLDIQYGWKNVGIVDADEIDVKVGGCGGL